MNTGIYFNKGIWTLDIVELPENVFKRISVNLDCNLNPNPASNPNPNPKAQNVFRENDHAPFGGK